MSAYFDTSIIVKLYTLEANSADAANLVSACQAPNPITHWQALEARTALRLKAFRQEISSRELQYSLAALQEDIASGRWLQPAYELADVYLKAEELSEKLAAALGCRTLDILHVAAALTIKAAYFVTFDARQGALARQSGLNVKP